MGKRCEMVTVDVKYDTTPHDGTPGPPWDDFEERILGVAAGRTDERGWSLADCANQTDEGGVGGPPIPVGGAANAKATTARRKRLKELYALLYKHELDTDHRTHIYQNRRTSRRRWPSRTTCPRSSRRLHHVVTRAKGLEQAVGLHDGRDQSGDLEHGSGLLPV